MNVGATFRKMLGMFSMYKGMLSGLLTIWVAAFALSFFDLMIFTPLAFIVSTVVLAITVYGASYLGGRIVGVPAHLDSSLITALILLCIMTPTIEAGGLLLLAVVGIVAGVSKYLVAYKGRHIFNPAAFAVGILGLVGIITASWWVATPLLTPIVLVVVLISLYQTRRYSIVGIFLVIAIALLLGLFTLSYGQSFSQSLVLLLSWPILFFAGIMLTEPLTLPPRRWQGGIVAAITAVLFALPFSVGWFQMTPALALLVGNIVAFIFAKRYFIKLTLKNKRDLTPTSSEFIFEPSRPVHFEAGQYMEIMLSHSKADLRGVRRTFSITSGEASSDVRFGIKFYDPSSSFKKRLREMPTGSFVVATTIAGDFVLPKNEDVPLLFVAGGIGITPFISQLRSMSEQRRRKVLLVYAVRSEGEIAYRFELEEFGVRVVLVSQAAIKRLPKAWQQSTATSLDESALKEAATDISQRNVYISGPPGFVSTAKRSARKLGARKIVTDYFTGY